MSKVRYKEPELIPENTRGFLQKVCFNRTATVDMTQFGFISKASPINFLMRPLKDQLEKICSSKPQEVCEPEEVLPLQPVKSQRRPTNTNESTIKRSRTHPELRTQAAVNSHCKKREKKIRFATYEPRYKNNELKTSKQIINRPLHVRH